MAGDTDTPMLRMAGVRKAFGPTVALDGVDLSVTAGQVHALIGENGAGKSTLMKILAGALQPDAGAMWLDGEPYAPRDPSVGRARGVAMIYQELSLAPHLTVMENIALGAEPTLGPFIRWERVRRRAVEALAQVGRGDLLPGALVRDLPPADRQLVEIARALSVGCRVLVLDEPTSSLGAHDIDRLYGLVRRLRDEGHAVVYISHFLEEVREVADCFTVLRDGRTVGHGDIASTSTDEIIRMMVGRAVEDLYHRNRRPAGEVALRVTGLSGMRKPDSASFELRRGEVLGIAGLVGAGRTELLRCIFGLDAVRSGRIRVGAYTGQASWPHGVGLLSEDRQVEGLAVNMSMADNVTLPTLALLTSPAQQQRAAQRWIDRLGVKCRSPRQRVSTLSGGNQQKTAIARLLHADTDVLLLDEPTRGVDVGSKAEIYRLIDELAAAGKAVLMVSSYLPELLGVCDRVMVMCRGKLGPARAVEDTDEHAIMLGATGA